MSLKWLASQRNKILMQIHETERNCGLTHGQIFSFQLFQSLTFAFYLLKPTGHVHQQFNIQQLYALPTLYLCVLYLSENKQRLVPLTA